MSSPSPTPPADAGDQSAPFAATSTLAEESLLPPLATSDAAGNESALANVSAQVYLERTVLGVLALALEDVCRARPPNPVDYFGSYLLRRSTANNTVEVTYDDTIPKAVPADGA
ncbi:Dpy-30 motif containing protein [Novymonas esmeraldas]|uniref:Dpy-30 motif containing protein n=1 Tax=Novymonas esmeraldas TaxID=1808958 RepID=A0AAW0ER36_9TRYP